MASRDTPFLGADLVFDSYVRVAAATPAIQVADCAHNIEAILSLIKKADHEQVRLLCLPELCITGYSSGDLFLQDVLIESAKNALCLLVKESAAYNVLVMVGLPILYSGQLFNAAAVFCAGRLLGLVPKTYIPSYGEFKEQRYFAAAHTLRQASVYFDGFQYPVPLSTDLLFRCKDLGDFCVAVEIGEDLWTVQPPSNRYAMAGASIIANLSASSEIVGRAEYRRSLVAGQSARLICGYVYANAGYGESSSDSVFSGHNIIAENGILLKESPPFGDGWAVSEIDLCALSHERRRINTFSAAAFSIAINKAAINQAAINQCSVVEFVLDASCKKLSRHIDPAPFIPADAIERQARCNEILNIQAAGLAKRLEHTKSRRVLLGLSGGLDSSLALMAAIRAVDMLEKSKPKIAAVTMPCFGTTERTKRNAHALCDALGLSCQEIDITESVSQHLKEIGHQGEFDLAYENAQARMRTMVLMDLGNPTDFMIGPGDLSELALGFTTYNGDHMSMYGINAGVPKSLVAHILQYLADTCDNPSLAKVLTDIINTPISPELLPPKDGEISQLTEEFVGPYELHDFFIYHVMRWGRKPTAVFHLACEAFSQKYSKKIILQWQSLFYRRFFSQQFKRNCLPDSPRIGSVGVSPRTSWLMPSDAVSKAWQAELAELAELAEPAEPAEPE